MQVSAVRKKKQKKNIKCAFNISINSVLLEVECCREKKMLDIEIGTMVLLPEMLSNFYMHIIITNLNVLPSLLPQSETFLM